METACLLPTAVTYSSLLRAHFSECTRAADIGDVMRVFLEMVCRTIQPDVVVWTTLLSGCARTQRTDLAVDVFQTMVKNADVPNHVTVNELSRTVGGTRAAKLCLE